MALKCDPEEDSSKGREEAQSAKVSGKMISSRNRDNAIYAELR